MEHIVLKWLFDRVEDCPDKTAIIYKNTCITYREVMERAIEVAGWLKANGVEQGDRVLLLVKNSDEFVYALFGILMNRGCFVPVNPQIDERQLDYIVKNCTPKCIILEQASVHMEKMKDLKNTIVSDVQECKKGDVKLDFYPLIQQAEGEDLAAIVYTSGTSRYPKGVVECNKQIVFVTEAINKVIGNTKSDAILCGLPLSFDYGLYQIFLTFQAGAALVLEEDFSVCANIPKIMRDYQVTGFPGVPTLFNLLILSHAFEGAELPKLRYITSTGDVFSVNTIKKLQQQLPHTTIYPMYGLTECKRVSIMPNGYEEERPTAVGLPLPGIDVRIVDTDNREVAKGVTGQLVIDGPNIMNGYWNNFEDTVEKYRYDEKTGRVQLYSGDLFYKDKEGYLFYQGRKERFIKCRGYKVSPVEVEHVLCTIDGVAQAAVFGVPDELQGEKVCAVVQMSKRIEKNYILEICKNKLQIEKIPVIIELTFKNLPRTINGKIDHDALRASVLKNADT